MPHSAFIRLAALNAANSIDIRAISHRAEAIASNLADLAAHVSLSPCPISAAAMWTTTRASRHSRHSVSMTLPSPRAAPPGDSLAPDGGPHVRTRWCGKAATVAHMATVAARDLRNHTAAVLREVAAGEPVTITVRGEAVAEIHPVKARRRRYMTRADVMEIIVRRQADPGLTADLAILAGDTTDDL